MAGLTQESLAKTLKALEGTDRTTPPPSPFGFDLHAAGKRQQADRSTLMDIISEHETYLYNGDEGVGCVACHGCSWKENERSLINVRRGYTGEIYSDETLETLAARHLAVEIEKAGYSRA